jgi:hypothetical protein
MINRMSTIMMGRIMRLNALAFCGACCAAAPAAAPVALARAPVPVEVPVPVLVVRPRAPVPVAVPVPVVVPVPVPVLVPVEEMGEVRVPDGRVWNVDEVRLVIFTSWPFFFSFWQYGDMLLGFYFVYNRQRE